MVTSIRHYTDTPCKCFFATAPVAIDYRSPSVDQACARCARSHGSGNRLVDAQNPYGELCAPTQFQPVSAKLLPRLAFTLRARRQQMDHLSHGCRYSALDQCAPKNVALQVPADGKSHLREPERIPDAV